MQSILFTVEREQPGAYSRGSLWRVQFDDRVAEQFYCGSSDISAWDALAWSLAERAVRIANGNHPTMSRSWFQTPEQWIESAKLAHSEVVVDLDEARANAERCKVAHDAIVSVPAATTENGTIQRATGLDAPATEPKKPAAARRARAKQKKG